MFEDFLRWLGEFFSSDSDADNVCIECPNLPEVRYVTNVDGKGWLLVTHDAPRNSVEPTFPPLPQGLKVEVYKIENGREYIKILEGRLKGTTASVSQRGNGGSYLSSINPHTGPATVVFNRTDGKVRFPGGELSAITDPTNKTPIGSWPLKIPYEVHPGGAYYEADSVFSGTWFRIDSATHDGVADRFLHPGRGTLGCTTVTDRAGWSNLYNYLIFARVNDQDVGTLRVVD